MKIRLTRRQVATAVLLAVGGGTALWWTAPWSDDIWELELPPPGNTEHPPFEVFLALSRIVLMRRDLDGAVARRMYDVFMAEPWGPKHIAEAYAGLRRAVVTRLGKASSKRAAPADVLESGERWFVSHLVTTWYLGVYFHEQRPTQRITLDGALMYDAMRGILVKPYVESMGYGRWVDPPAEQEPRK